MPSRDLIGPDKKHRMTHQRQVILEEIRKVNTHPTADEVYTMVRKRLPRISMGTVYRNLETLSTLGLIGKVGPVTSQMRFDGNTRVHYHIRCIRCGRLGDAPMEPVGHMEDSVRGVTDYTILGHRLEFVGICPMCGKKEGLSPEGTQKAEN